MRRSAPSPGARAATPRVPSGFLGLGQEHSTPLSVMRRIEGEQIQLKAAKDQLDELEAADGALDVENGAAEGSRSARRS